MTEQEALVVLNAIPSLNGIKARKLINFFGSAQRVLAQDYANLNGAGIIKEDMAGNIIDFSKDNFLSDEYNLVHHKGIKVLTIADDDYPHLLSQIPDAPLVLYILGKPDILHAASVAMVGSRVCSYYGRAMAEEFAKAFVDAGLVIVSGMARGIDTHAHQGCLKAGGQTIAVLGCGLNHIYPKENQQLLEKIVAQGAVISELPMDVAPLSFNFPRRNRIITGLSLATVVIEAGQRSGALISASFAAEQGRDIFALPCNIDYATSRGSNQLIQDGARVALSPSDVLEELKGQIELFFCQNQAISSTEKVKDKESPIVKYLSTEPVHIDTLVKKSRKPIGEILELMLHLQIQGKVKELPGKFFVKG